MILMIDEEERRLKTTKDFLMEFGYAVKFIDNIDDGYEFIKMNFTSIDALILDIMMPWGNLFTATETENGLLCGYVFFKLLRKEFGDKVPIIIYTAINSAEIISILKKENNCSVIKKPNLPSKIVRELNCYNILPTKIRQNG